MKKNKILKIGFILAVAACLCFLFVPAYLRNGLLYWYADLDDYKIFENAEVKPGSSAQEWEQDSSYNSFQLSRSDRDYLEKHKTAAFLVIQNGKVLYEEYWDGYSSQSHSNLFSAAKSIVSLLIGAAIDEGKIASVNEPVEKYIPEFKGKPAGKITIKNLLTMSSGLDWEEAYTSPFSVTAKAYYGENLRKVTTSQKLAEQPGVRFLYQSGDTQLLAYVVEKAVGKTVAAYAQEKLWQPMGAVNPALWSLDKKNGDAKSFCCFNTNARDAARFGQLILNNGKWNGKQIISEKYMTEAVTPAGYLLNEQKTAPVDFYGYQFWILPYKGRQIPYMRGHLGQYIYALKDKNAVVVRFGKMRDERHRGEITLDIPKYVDIAHKIIENHQ